MADFSELKGKTLTAIVGEVGGDSLHFYASDGSTYRLYHYQDCCESVYLEDIAGNCNDLVGSPIIMAEEVSNMPEPPPPDRGYAESYTWTFYKLATTNGYVTLRWFGESNGYYSESVDFEQTKEATVTDLPISAFDPDLRDPEEIIQDEDSPATTFVAFLPWGDEDDDLYDDDFYDEDDDDYFDDDDDDDYFYDEDLDDPEY